LSLTDHVKYDNNPGFLILTKLTSSSTTSVMCKHILHGRHRKHSHMLYSGIKRDRLCTFSYMLCKKWRCCLCCWEGNNLW